MFQGFLSGADGIELIDLAYSDQSGSKVIRFRQARLNLVAISGIGLPEYPGSSLLASPPPTLYPAPQSDLFPAYYQSIIMSIYAFFLHLIYFKNHY